jgi:hypothetical protein
MMGRWSPHDTKRLHQKMGTILNRLLPPTPASAVLDRGVAFIPARLSRVYLYREDGRIRRRYGAMGTNLIWFGIGELVEEFGGLLALCSAQDCGKIFVRERRQQYCSARCSQKVRSATWYHKHREKATMARRLRYERTLRANNRRLIVGGRRPG